MTQEEMILVLGQHPKLGAQSIKKCLKAFEFDSSFRDLETLVGEKIAKFAREAIAQFNIDEIREKLRRNNVGYFTFMDKAYPELLLEIPDFPALLYIRGSLESLQSPSVSVVGSRKYTQYGAKVARLFSKSLAEAGLVVISGLALGIDTIAHRGALDGCGQTVAVLGCGLDLVYPASNQALAREIIDRNGAIISEYPLGAEPYKGNFPARNRIIAGLSPDLLVIEAALDSGALITAKAALEYNREVCAIPGDIWSESSRGTNYLIKEGARLVTEPEEILGDYDIKKHNARSYAKEYLPENKTEEAIMAFLADRTMSADDIIRESHDNVAEISHALTMLEMKGILENVNGFWSRCAGLARPNKNLKKKGKR